MPLPAQALAAAQGGFISAAQGDPISAAQGGGTSAAQTRPKAARQLLHRRTPLAMLMISALQGSLAYAQELPPVLPGGASIALKPSYLLGDRPRKAVGGLGLTFVAADKMFGRPDLETVLEGHAELRRGETVIRADRLEYYHPGDLAKARGQVRINRSGNVFEGDLLELKIEAFEGFFTNTRYSFLKNQAYGQAARIDFVDDKRAVIRQASYTTCQRQDYAGWMPDWILTADTLRLDNEAQEGRASGAVLSFLGVPVLPVPAFDFPLGDKRRSGFLPPSIGVSSLDGTEFSIPYYWDIAPNRDATFTPEIKTKRGVNLNAEFRYLETNYSGSLRGNYLPGDRLRERDRYGYNIVHQGTINTGLAGLQTLGLNININRVSDDNYWRDFGSSTRSSGLIQRVLPSEVAVSWASGNYSVLARSLRWQTQQAIDLPLIPPYNRLPQVTGRYTNSSIYGLKVSAEVDYSQFEADSRLTVQPNARRTYALGQVSYPVDLSGVFVTPKVQLHATRYDFDAPLGNFAGAANNITPGNSAKSASRVLPTFSLDSGLVFEREASLLGTEYLQTLEPRAFYVYTPFRDQSQLPNYDSGANDFNFSTIYTENPFVGNDRIADNNLFTLGLTSRLLNPNTGAEAARFGLAQRLRLSTQRVTLPGVAPVADRISDILLGGAVNLTPTWGADAVVQYNPKSDRSERAVVSTFYNPGKYKLLTAAYRLQKGASEQLDLSWQWPISAIFGGGKSGVGPTAGNAGKSSGTWYTVGRLNYSLFDGKLVDSLVGFEYDGCCYIARVVIERLQRAGAVVGSQANKRIMFQLEFNGFSRVGSNPLRTLKESIPRYQPLGPAVDNSSRFANYE